MIKNMMVGAVAAVLFSGSAALAAAYSFDLTTGPSTPQAGPLTFNSGPLSVDVVGRKVDTSGNVTGNALIASYSGGLGVCSGVVDTSETGKCGNDRHTVDALWVPEMAVFTFSDTVSIKSVTFSLFGSHDDFDFKFFDGGNYFDDVNVAGSGYVRTYTFAGTWTGDTFGIGASSSGCSSWKYCDDDSFKIKKVVVKHEPNVIPLPAAGWMLLAGLGSLAAARKRVRSA